MTDIQASVVNKRIRDGYVVLGETISMTNGLVAIMLTKGKHTLVINSLGYDEHYFGKTWNLK